MERITKDVGGVKVSAHSFMGGIEEEQARNVSGPPQWTSLLMAATGWLVP